MQKGVLRKRRPVPPSEYGKQLKEKQELKALYNLRERQFRRYIKEILETTKKTGNPEEQLLQRLEKRLDNVVFRMGLAESRKQARQIVSHGHMQVNGRVVHVPSYELEVGDVIRVRQNSQERTFFKNRKLALQKYEAPSWIAFHKDTLEATIKGVPQTDHIGASMHLPLIFEFYTK